MNILSVSHIFPNQLYPTYGVFIKERLKAIAKLVNLTIVSPLPQFPFLFLTSKYKDLDRLPKVEYFDGLTVHHPFFFMIPKIFKFSDGYFYYHSLDSFISRLIISSEIDLLDFHWVYPDAFAGIKWARKFKKKIVITIRGNESICYAERSLRKKKVIYTLQNADHIIAVSNDLKEKIVHEYEVLKDNVTVVPNGIYTDKFKMLNKQIARYKCGLDLNKRYILSLSRLSYEKGLKYLLKAFSVAKMENTILIIAGDGPIKNELKNLALKLNIASKTHFVGAVKHEDTVLWYNAADVYCLPSLWEGCPNTVIESLACGTPVIATSVGGIPDMVPANKYGYLVPPRASDSLADALREALQKKWDRDTIAAFGSRNTWDDVARQVYKVFYSLIR